MKGAHVAFSALLLAVAGLGLAFYQGWITIPDRWAPWTALRIDSEPNLLTRYKLSRLTRDTEQCQQVLATADMRYVRLPDRPTGEACGLYNAVRVERTSARVSAPFSLS